MKIFQNRKLLLLLIIVISFACLYILSSCANLLVTDPLFPGVDEDSPEFTILLFNNLLIDLADVTDPEDSTVFFELMDITQGSAREDLEDYKEMLVKITDQESTIKDEDLTLFKAALENLIIKVQSTEYVDENTAQCLVVYYFDEIFYAIYHTITLVGEPGDWDITSIEPAAPPVVEQAE